MSDLDAIESVIDEISNVTKLDNEELTHGYSLCLELLEIFANEMADRGLIEVTKF